MNKGGFAHHLKQNASSSSDEAVKGFMLLNLDLEYTPFLFNVLPDKMGATHETLLEVDGCLKEKLMGA